MDNTLKADEYISRFSWISWAISSKVTGAVIGINCLVVFLMLFPEIPDEAMDFLKYLDALFNVYFVFEAATKIAIDGKRYFHNAGDIFDFTLVVFVIIAYLLGEGQTVTGFYVLRIIRVMKFTMVFKKIEGSKSLYQKIKAAFKASLGILLVMGTLILIIAMIMTIFFDTRDPEDFGNPFKSIYTVIRLFTLEGWYEIPNSLTSDLPTFSAFVAKSVFSILVILGGVFGISFITSNVTDNLAQDDNKKLLDRIDELEEKIDRLTDALERQDRIQK